MGDGDEPTDALIDRINHEGSSHVTRTVLDGRSVTRISIGARTTEREHVGAVWRSTRDAVVMPDILVVGAGVAGASVAFAAARRGADVTVVDPGRPGRATAAGAGIIAPWATALTGEVYSLYAAGADGYPALLEQLGAIGLDDVGYAVNGALVLSHHDDLDGRLRSLTERCARSTVAGTPELVDPDEGSRLFPPLLPDALGIHVPGGARVDGRRLAGALLDGVAHYGGKTVDGEVTCDDSVVCIDGRPVDADTVVIAAGAWTPPLVHDLLTDRRVDGTTSRAIGVVPQRGQICHLRLPDTTTGRWPSVLPPSDHYIVPFDDGRVVVGATREHGVAEARTTAAGVAKVLTQALEIAPGLAEAELLETRVGIRPYPGDRNRPTIGLLDDRTWVVTGFGAIGLTIGPTVGDRVADMALGGEPDELIAPFAPF